MKKAFEKYCEWASTPKGNKIMGRVMGAFSAVAAGTIGYMVYDLGRAQGACDTLVEEKAFMEEVLKEATKEVLEESP